MIERHYEHGVVERSWTDQRDSLIALARRNCDSHWQRYLWMLEEHDEETIRKAILIANSFGTFSSNARILNVHGSIRDGEYTYLEQPLTGKRDRKPVKDWVRQHEQNYDVLVIKTCNIVIGSNENQEGIILPPSKSFLFYPKGLDYFCRFYFGEIYNNYYVQPPNSCPLSLEDLSVIEKMKESFESNRRIGISRGLRSVAFNLVASAFTY